jgi:predicted outer membrane protein
MTNSGSRPATRALRTIAIAATPLSLLAVGLPAAAHAAGPISAADRDFLAAVHTTAAYASSASQMAQTKASAGAVKTIGKKILAQDKQLDTLARTTATKLQSPFPSAAPSALAELESAQSDIFDVGYISKLRETDGTLLQLAATTRVYTRNDLVRDLAQRTTTTRPRRYHCWRAPG